MSKAYYVSSVFGFGKEWFFKNKKVWTKDRRKNWQEVSEICVSAPIDLYCRDRHSNYPRLRAATTYIGLHKLDGQHS